MRNNTLTTKNLISKYPIYRNIRSNHRHYFASLNAMSTETNWFAYIVQCNDGTLYTGITTDIQRRLTQHNSDKYGARYTRARQPVTLAHLETCETHSDAAKREHKIKQLNLSKKRILINDQREKTITLCKKISDGLTATIIT